MGEGTQDSTEILWEVIMYSKVGEMKWNLSITQDNSRLSSEQWAGKVQLQLEKTLEFMLPLTDQTQ